MSAFINTFKHVKDALYVILSFLYYRGFLSIEQIRNRYLSILTKNPKFLVSHLTHTSPSHLTSPQLPPEQNLVSKSSKYLLVPPGGIKRIPCSTHTQHSSLLSPLMQLVSGSQTYPLPMTKNPKSPKFCPEDLPGRPQQSLLKPPPLRIQNPSGG